MKCLDYFLKFASKYFLNGVGPPVKYAVAINCEDVNVGTDGWSISPLIKTLMNGRSFKEICPGTDEDRAYVLTGRFPGTHRGYDDLVSTAKRMGVRGTHSHKCTVPHTMVLCLLCDL